MTRIKTYLGDLCHIKLIHKRYKKPIGKSSEWWGSVLRRYGNAEKKLASSSVRWRIICYDDGRRELAYLRVLKTGLFSGMRTAIYRGVIIPRRIGYSSFAHITDIKMAF